jgi:1,4-alpha-glucan branching enzyme
MIRVIRAQFPEATDVCLLGEFNNWSTAATPMMQIGLGIWEARLEASAQLKQVWFFVFDTSRRFGRLVRGTPIDAQWHNA